MDKNDIRARYYAALAEGHGIAGATQIANGGEREAPRKVAPAAEVQGDGFPADDAMREAIKAATGKAPHWKASREKLVEQYKALRHG